MSLSPPPQIKEFNWIWLKWIAGLWEYLIFPDTRTTVTTTTHTAGAEMFLLVDDDTAGGAVTITLPLAAKGKREYTVKKLGTTGNVVIDGNGSETVDGAANATLSAQYESVTVVSDGTAWFIV